MNEAEKELKKEENPVEIPPDQLSEEILAEIVENFILREGTDYGHSEVTYESKVRQIKQQIASREVRIIFDLASETVSLHRRK